MISNNLVSAANKNKAKACFYGNTLLDQRCLKGKRPLKIRINFRNKQAKKSKSIALLTKADSPKSD